MKTAEERKVHYVATVLLVNRNTQNRYTFSLSIGKHFAKSFSAIIFLPFRISSCIETDRFFMSRMIDQGTDVFDECW